jgi:hypothetical protein
VVGAGGLTQAVDCLASAKPSVQTPAQPKKKKNKTKKQKKKERKRNQKTK